MKDFSAIGFNYVNQHKDQFCIIHEWDPKSSCLSKIPSAKLLLESHTLLHEEICRLILISSVFVISVTFLNKIKKSLRMCFSVRLFKKHIYQESIQCFKSSFWVETSANAFPAKKFFRQPFSAKPASNRISAYLEPCAL